MSHAVAFVVRLVRALLAFVVLAGFTVAVPWLLAVAAGWPLDWIGWPQPSPLPSGTDLYAAVTSQWSDHMLLTLLASIGWMLWARFVHHTAIEIIEASAAASESRRGATRNPVGRRGPIRWVAAVLVGAIVGAVFFDAARVVTGIATGAAADAAARRPAVAVAAAPTADTGPGTTLTVTVATNPAATSAPAATLAAPVLAAHHGDSDVPAWARDAPGGTHHVQRGDNLWDLAESRLGDPYRWREIYTLNRAHIQANGFALTDPDEIHIGWVLALPARDAVPAPANPAPDDSTRGDATTGDTGSGGPAAAEPAPGSGASPGPSTAPSLPATTAPTTGPTNGPTTEPSTSPPAAPGAAATASSQPSADSPPADDGVFTPPSATMPVSPPASSPSPGSALPTASTSDAVPRPHADQSQNASPNWISIAGTAMGVGFAAALVYAVAMVWKRRRHRYRPTPITSPVLRDADMTPPLAALTRLRQGVRRAAPHLLDRQPDRGPTVREYIAADVKPPLPPSGPSGAELAGVGALTVTAGLGLQGPAALDAARALLVATLTAGDADDPDAQGRIIAPASTLATLLGVSAVDLDPMRRLTVAPTFAAALALLEEEIIRRSRIVADQDATTLSALREEWTFGEPLPQMLLIADVPDESWHARLSTAIRLGKNVDIGTVLIGAWPDGTTLTVAADGTTQGGDGERVAVLDTAATTSILAMLAEAHGDIEPPAARPALHAAHPEPNSATAPEPEADLAPVDARTPDSASPTAASMRQQPTVIPAAAAYLEPGNRVQARVLGDPVILDREGTPVRGLRAKSLELFVYLVVHRGGANLDDITEALWPDVTVSRAKDRLSTCVGNLRAIIRSVAQTGSQPAENDPKIEPVINTGGHYHLDPALLQVDWWTVRDAYARVATATDDTARLVHLRTAIAAASGGGLADGSGYEWIDTDREHARRRLVKVFAQAAAIQADNDPTTALALHDAACALDPLSDELARRAMRTAARLGDAAGIGQRLTTLRRELDDAGIDIDPDTEELATTLLRDLANP